MKNKLWVWWHYGRFNMKDNMAHWIARHLPRRIQYWCYINVHASATTGTYADKTPYEVTWDMAIKDWNLSG